MIYTRLIFLFVGFALTAFNIILGLKLSWNHADNSELHLISAIIIVVSNLIGCFGLIAFTKRQMEEVALKGKVKDLQNLAKNREACIRISLLVIGISIISLITGTASQAGEIPWIHGVLGFALFISSLVCIYRWLLLDRRYASNTTPT